MVRALGHSQLVFHGQMKTYLPMFTAWMQMWIGCSTGTVYTVVLQLRCWQVWVRCLNFDTAAYTAPITAVVTVFSWCLAHMVL